MTGLPGPIIITRPVGIKKGGYVWNYDRPVSKYGDLIEVAGYTIREEESVELAEDWACASCDQGEEENKPSSHLEDNIVTEKCSSHKDCGHTGHCFKEQGRCVNMDTTELRGMLQQLEEEQKRIH